MKIMLQKIKNNKKFKRFALVNGFIYDVSSGKFKRKDILIKNEYIKGIGNFNKEKIKINMKGKIICLEY